MDKNKINEAIAVAIGYRYYQSGGGTIWLSKEKPANPLFREVAAPKDLSQQAIDDLPNFYENLNAIHRAENILCDSGDISDPNHNRYTYLRLLYNTVEEKRQPSRAKCEDRAKCLCEAFNLI